MIEQFFSSLEQHPIFKQTDRNKISFYLNEQACSVIDFVTDDLIYSSASPEKQVGLLLQGKASVQTGSASDYTLLNTVGEVELFGIANLYAEDEPFPTVITAATSCTVLFFKDAAFRAFLENDPTATKNFLKFQSQKILYLNRKIMTFTAGSAEKKMASFILDHEVNHVFTPPCSMSSLANMLGIGRASLYRALDHLIDQGWIEKRDRSFIILDPDSLSKFL